MPTIGTTWRHKKRGTTYRILHIAAMQCATEPEFERMFEDDGLSSIKTSILAQCMCNLSQSSWMAASSN